MKFYLCDISVKYDGVSEPFYFPQIYDFFMIRLIFTGRKTPSLNSLSFDSELFEAQELFTQFYNVPHTVKEYSNLFQDHFIPIFSA